MDDIVEIMMQKANWLKAVSLSSHSGCHQEAELFIAAAKRIKELEAENKELGDGIEIVNNAGVKIRRRLEARIEELEIAKSIGIQACGLLKEQIEVLEGTKTVETQVICGLVNCLQRNTKGECGHTSIHFQPCSDCANVAACSEYTE